MVHLWKDKKKIYNYRGKIKAEIIDNLVVLNMYKYTITDFKFYLPLLADDKYKRKNFHR